jgi:hypothetical protein
VDDIEAIKQPKARYFRTMDTKDWGGIRQVLADDVVFYTTASGGGVVRAPTSSWRSSVRRWPRR